ncbi:TetR/AcrR family transcriptional regulator [Agromyces sp. LHK192]|uniref:TetR/AcrR family transcriptional regulator n=1 Tax=Agromyces sp. LHK192 TaxID=2498704 RepID=UPI00196A9275|nr:TetR/AcrR family transcriptional regulator [Agromyces sp. LHK192]
MGTVGREYDMSTRSVAAGRTRQRLLLAARDRFTGARFADVTLADLASTAGVTVQTLLNHFGSKEGLLLAASEEFAAEVADLRGPVEPGDLDGAVDALIRHYEFLGDMNWRFAADVDPDGPFAGLLAGARDEHRAWLETVFAPALPDSPAERDDLLVALYAATDVGSWKLLRRDLGCSPDQTRATIRRLIAGLLERGTP